MKHKKYVSRLYEAIFVMTILMLICCQRYQNTKDLQSQDKKRVLLFTEEKYKGSQPNQEEKREVCIRIVNTSKYYYEKIQANFCSEEVNFGNLHPNQKSEYRCVKKAYSYAYLKLTVNGKERVIQPTDFVGETSLAKGSYSFYLNISSPIPEICVNDIYTKDAEDQPRIHGVTLGDHRNDIVEALGEPIRIVNWGDGGRVLQTYEYGGISFVLLDCREGEDCSILYVCVTDDNYVFPNGLKIGLSEQEVQTLLNRRGEKEGDSVVFWTGVFHGYKVTFENGKANLITLIDES